MNIGITGSTGVLGRICYGKLTAHGHRIFRFRGNVCEKGELSSWLHEDSLDAVLHFAALVPVDKVKANPLNAYQTNVGGTINLLKALSECGFYGWFFYASSSHVYRAQDNPLTEESEIAPSSLYGMTKYMGEKICYDFSESAPFQICMGRIFSFYHNSQSGSFLYPVMKQRLKTDDLNKPFFLRGANSIRDFLNAEEVCEIIIKLMEKKYAGIINIASGKGVKIRDFVQSMTETTLQIESDDSENSIIGSVDRLNQVLV